MAFYLVSKAGPCWGRVVTNDELHHPFVNTHDELSFSLTAHTRQTCTGCPCSISLGPHLLNE
ncbi:hypothetical protein, variant 2 [Cryptococcus neoformans var. grubii H99]|uniref:Uncharacterized protein n=1 Tax=Cryptococcus neoformans (strain H99 / ATCC 208821 / CBS 10515 / FGSC 9487) TaxID=235443 RepID=T2BNY4_CRYN9|nr:hypothetical protein, variant 2 [Cryptococcus neoformans var. grubii H99]AGV14426.1 hypothetical protein, variant 2 [Cryptococcus neoformans var. grubii H99]AUB25396.1 hypothetical protein CKF44_02253 [Cryptococcus neoformans var. grubii]|eukprot:XP_012050039.1 hypothetical protein, variant 2 [Cryptococcus neoformans var. grubii H99]